MNKFYLSVYDALSMLDRLERDLNLRHLSPNELKVFYSIIVKSECNPIGSSISDVVSFSGMSRSTVYKTLKKLSDEGIIHLGQSEEDGRESLVSLVNPS